MKRNFGFAVMLLFGMMQSFAQKDVTKYFLANYSFDDNFDYTATQTTAVKQEIKDIPGWTQGFTHDYTISGVYEFGFAGTFNGAKVPTQGYDGEAGGGLALSTGWSCDFPYTQEVTLPAGTYTIYAPSYNGCDKTDATSLLAWIPNSGTAVTSTVTSYAANAWTNDQVTFTLTATTTGKIRIGLKAAAGGSANSAKLVVDYVRIMGSDMTIDKSILKELLTTANGLYGDGTGNDAQALKSAIDTAQKVYDDAAADLESVLTQQNELSAAIEEYKKHNASEENPLDYTSYIVNPSFELNSFKGWTNTNFALQSNTAFTKKDGSYYIEKWVSAGKEVGDATISQTLTNLPNGRYKLVAAAQNYNQSSTSQKCTGAYIFAGDQQTAVYTPDDYSVIFTSISGEMKIGYKAVAASGNWLSVDNFRLYLIGYTDDAAIYAELQRIITSAESLQQKTMSVEAAATLAAALTTAKTVTATADEADIQAATKTLTAAIETAETSVTAYTTLASTIAEGETLASQHMQNEVLSSLNDALAQARTIDGSSTDSQVAAAQKKLDTAISSAESSIAAYTTLQQSITAAKACYDASLTDAAAFQEAIAEAQTIYDACSGDDNTIITAATALDKSILAFRVANGSGTVPTVVTDTRFARGNSIAFGRMSVTGVASSNILEQGFCWSTEKEPTVLDSRSTAYLTNNGKIYKMPGLTPATIYYARAYCITKTYAVGYGDVIKIVTIPKANITWSYNNGAGAEANARINNALSVAIDTYWNNLTSIKGFHVSCSYGSGTSTADCGYGGSMRIGPNSSYQQPGTVMHESNHGIGVGTTPLWYGPSCMRSGSSTGYWLGDRVTDVLTFWDNTYTQLRGDATHMWPYGINGAQEDTHSEVLYYCNGLVNQALCEDGLIPVNYWSGGFCLPAYSLNQEDTVKYYLKNESADRGLNTSYLIEGKSGALKWKEISTNDALSSDSAAWYITFNPAKQYYQLRNAATGHYISYSSGFKALAKTTLTTNEDFHVMKGRVDVSCGSGKEAVTERGYWFIHPESSSTPATLTATASGNVGTSSFDLQNTATQQRWLVMNEAQVRAFETASKGVFTSELDSMIAHVRALKEVPHKEDVEGADVALETILVDVEVQRDAATTASEVYSLISTVRSAGLAFLQDVTPNSLSEPFDLTFLLSNPSIDGNSGWSDTPTYNYSCCEYFQKTFDFNQTLKGMPSGCYELRAQAFQRVGAYADNYTAWMAGTSVITSNLYIKTTTATVKNIMDDAQEKTLGNGEVTVGSALYIPNTMEAASNFFADGLYDNSVVTDVATKNSSLKLGIKCTSSDTGYWTIFDNFRLYYYGSMSKEEVTPVEKVAVSEDEMAIPVAIYNLKGIRLSSLQKGVNIVRHSDGTIKKVLIK